MHLSIQRALIALQNEQGSGTLLYPLEISRALNLVLDEPTLLHDLDDGFDIISYSRVSYSRRDDWIDVLVCLRADERRKKYVITFDPRTNELISISCIKAEVLRVDEQESACLPFALEIESHTTDVTAPDTSPHFVKLNTRRQMFEKALAAALLPVIGIVSPAAAATTPYTTNSNTGSNKSTTTPKGTSGLTTPNDNDTRTDNEIDQTTDNTNDPTQDTRNDP